MRIDRVSRWAEFADGFVLFNVTRPTFGTREVVARIAALVVNAGHVHRAAAIAQTDGNGGLTVDVDADTDGTMIEDVARFVRSGTRIALTGARILTAA